MSKRYDFSKFAKDAEFEESKHPRDEGGKFGSGGGSSFSWNKPRTVIKNTNNVELSRLGNTFVVTTPDPKEAKKFNDIHDAEAYFNQLNKTSWNFKIGKRVRDVDE